MLATAVQAPELAISQEEAKTLAHAANNVAKHYDLGAKSQKSLDWAQLFMALGTVYGSRLFAMKLRKGMEKTQPKQTNVYSFGNG